MSELVIGNDYQYKLAWQLLVSAYIGKFNGNTFLDFFFLPAALRVIVLKCKKRCWIPRRPNFSIYVDSCVVGGEHS